MSAYELERLIKLWAAEKITAEQAIGQILQQLQLLSARVGQLEQQLARERRRSSTSQRS